MNSVSRLDSHLRIASVLTRARLALATTVLTVAALASGGAHASLILNLDASALELNDGQNVSAWNGISAAGTPTYRTNQTVNGKSAVEFDGSDHFGQVSAASMPASGAGDFIVAAVVKANSIGSYHNIIDDDASNRPMLWIDLSFNYELNFAGGSGAKGVGAGTDGWDIVVADSRTGMLYVNSATANATGGGAVAYFAGEAFDLFNRDGGQTFQGLGKL